MISTKVFITTSAFTLALAGAVIGNKEASPLTSYGGYNMQSICVLTRSAIREELRSLKCF